MNDQVSAEAVSVVLCGGKGRMGQAITACAAREPDRYRIAGQLERDKNSADTLAVGEIVIDFSSAPALDVLLAGCRQRRCPLVIGTTGHTAEQRAAIHGAARDIPIVFAANYSVGVNALFWLTRQAARILGPDFDLEIVEVHHRLKKDAPSGTARRLAELLADARGLDYGAAARHGRKGIVGARGEREIGVHAVRGGDVVGEHTVLFADAGERLELTHRASSRETFALGALRAAAWLRGQPPGLYDMEDVLGLRKRATVPASDDLP